MSGTPDIFDQIVLVGDARLGIDAVEDIFRASLITGAACARSVVTRVEPLRAGWDEENQVGAALLTEFWSALIAARLLGQVEERDELLAGISERFAGDIFGSSRSALEWSLQAFERQLVLGAEIDPQGGTLSFSPMTWHYLYWRSRELLVGDVQLQGRYHPAVDLAAWHADRRNAGVTPPDDLDEAVIFRDILLWGMDTASQHFSALRQAAEGSDPPDQ